MKYLLIFENGNGYSCNCCRRTWINTDTLEFENDEDAKTYIETHNKQNDITSDDHDSLITACYPISGETII